VKVRFCPREGGTEIPGRLNLSNLGKQSEGGLVRPIMGNYPRGRTEVSKWNEAFLSPTSFHPYALSLAHPEVLDTYHSGKT